MAGNRNSGRKPQHANLRLLNGRGEGKDSAGRPVPRPPAFTRIPPQKPRHLSKFAGELWDRVVEQLPNLGLLKDLDGPALEIACETYSRWRVAKEMRIKHGMIEEGESRSFLSPWVAAEERAGKEFRAWCAEFGLSPSAEMRLASVEGGGDPEANPFAGPQGRSV
jgi:P27 family predicted phage terminase small subunit